jgi:hypothetical protein
MFKKFILNSFTILLLFSGNLHASDDKITIQLLIGKRRFGDIKETIGITDLPRHHSIPFPHVSFIEIEDEGTYLRQNFEKVATEAVELVEAWRNALKREKNELTFVGQGIGRYEAEKTGQIYWCLEDADNKNEGSTQNNLLKQMASYVEGGLNKLIEQGEGKEKDKEKDKEKEKEKEENNFTMKQPSEIVEGMRQQSQRASRPIVRFAKGFPHVSVAKGEGIDSDVFSTANNSMLALNITGINIMFNYKESTTDKKGPQIPQISIKKFFEEQTYRLTSRFSCLHACKGQYPSVNSALERIGELDSENIKGEIRERLAVDSPDIEEPSNYKRSRIEPETTTPPTLTESSQGESDNGSLFDDCITLIPQIINSRQQLVRQPKEEVKVKGEMSFGKKRKRKRDVEVKLPPKSTPELDKDLWKVL